MYGIALVFGATGTTSLSAIVAAASNGSANLLLLTIGAALILVGLSFKIAAVPFHMWTPDVYQGAPSAVTAFMAAGAKIAGFAALLRVFSLAFPALASNITPILAVISALTMIVGNLIAIAQTNIKRLLAYSSIAHAGYILMAFVPYGQPKVVATSVAAGLFYLVSYALTNFGAWAVVIALEKTEGKGLEITDYAGLGRKYPALAAAMTVFMLSLTGIPPTLGFVGKFYLFRAVINGQFYLLAVIGMLYHSHIRLLLSACGRNDVHARRRSRTDLRSVAQSHLGRVCYFDGGRELAAWAAVRLGQSGGLEIVLEIWFSRISRSRKERRSPIFRGEGCVRTLPP